MVQIGITHTNYVEIDDGNFDSHGLRERPMEMQVLRMYSGKFPLPTCHRVRRNQRC